MKKNVLEPDFAVSYPFSPSSEDDRFNSNIKVKRKKLRLFGFDVDLCSNNGKFMAENEEGDEDAICAHTVKERSVKNSASDWRYECQFCFKKFTNSQALGGHQNAHKKERLKKKRMQLEAKTASINFYLQSVQFPSWYYNPAACSYNIPDLKLFKESQINFNQEKSSLNGCDVLDSCGLQISVPFQEDEGAICSRLAADTNKFDKNKTVVIKPAALPVSKQSCERLDFVLGLVAKQ